MTLTLNRVERIARMGADIRIGVPVAVLDGDQGALVLAIEALSSARLADLREIAPKLELALTLRRAQTLKVAAYDGDVARLAVPSDADIWWIRAMADPARDMDSPMKGPFQPIREGSADIHRAGIALAKRANLLPAVIVLPVPNVAALMQEHGLNQIEASDLLGVDVVTELHEVSAARVPLEVSEKSRVHVFRPRDGGEEHYAIEIGSPDRAKPVLSRLHSACFTGDLLGSLKCDCGPQLRTAMAQIGEEGAGVLLYMNQEGRG
ncbi:MAG: GTP cyclohydrolase II, partial [Alphaproteobacteria bacterium]